MAGKPKRHYAPIRKPAYHAPVPGSDRWRLYSALKRLARDGYRVRADVPPAEVRAFVGACAPSESREDQYVFWKAGEAVFYEHDQLLDRIPLHWEGDAPHILQRLMEVGLSVYWSYSAVEVIWVYPHGVAVDQRTEFALSAMREMDEMREQAA